MAASDSQPTRLPEVLERQSPGRSELRQTLVPLHELRPHVERKQHRDSYEQEHTVSAGRKHRRTLARNITPPEHILEAVRRATCPDCNSETTLTADSHGLWHSHISHDDNCPQLVWRQTHGATHQTMLIAEPGKTVPAEAIAELAQAVASQPGVTALRISTEPALSWQERRILDREAD